MWSEFDAVFRARSVAVVGASEEENQAGHTILKNLINSGFQGAMYPVNPNNDTILWLKAYPALSTVGSQIDLAVLAVEARDWPLALAEAGQAGVKAVILLNGRGEEINKGLELEVMDIAQKYNFRVFGPNCQGLIYTHNDMCAAWPLITAKGTVAVIAQSGTIGAAITGWAQKDGIGISGFASLGDRVDVDESDMLEYFLHDSCTRVIALNVDNIKHRERFERTCLKVAAEKPVVFLQSDKATKDSHDQGEGSKSKLIRARNITEFYDFVKAFALAEPIPTPQVAVITSSKGCGILAANSIKEQNLELLNFADKLNDKLKSKLPGHWVIRNPLHLAGDTDGASFLAAAELVGRQSAGALVLIFGGPVTGAVEVVEAMAKRSMLHPICCYIGGGDIESGETVQLHRSGYPVYPTPERAIAAARALYDYGRNCMEFKKLSGRNIF